MKKFFHNKIKLLISLTFLTLFLFNTIAYSGLATKLAITSEAMFRPRLDIRVTDIKLKSATNGAVESYSPKYNVDSTTTGFTLPTTEAKITYTITVINNGNVRQTIYNFIKNAVDSDSIKVEISGFKSVCADVNCNTKNNDYDIVHYEGEGTDFKKYVTFDITFSTTKPSNTTINVIENYTFRPVYKIDFDANGGQDAPSSIYKVFGESTNLPTKVPTKSNYNFTGWSKSSTSTTAEYKAGTTYEPSESTGSTEDYKNIKDTILYAVWQKKQATLDLNYIIDGTVYYSGYNNKIQTGIKVNGEDKGYLNDFSGTYDYGTSYEIYGFKIDGVTIPYSKKYTVDGTNHLGISFNTINFKVNDANLGSVTPIQLIVIPGTTYKVSNNVITLSDGRIATASPKTITGYTSKFSSYTITPNSTTINTKITATANFTKEVNTYTITLDNKSATTAGTTAIYGKYGAGIYLDSALKNVMTTTTNKITVPAKTGYTFKGYYTKENGQGDQIINENGYITDKATNTTYIANTTLYAYYKDETKPTLTLTNSSNGNWTNKDVTITLNGADSGSGIKEYQLKYSGSSNAWKKTTAPKDTWSAERNETVYYRTVDNAGNESDAVSTSIRIDKTAPKIELNGAASSSEINNNSVTIPIKITETLSGINNADFTASDISVLINETKVNPSTKTLTYNNVSNGIYSYTLTLSGITLNGKVTLEIAAGAVKDIATNSNSKATLDPSITVSNIYTISLNGNGATTAGTPAIYEKYNTGIYLDSTLTKAMTTSANAIPTTPSRSYTVSFNANNTGITIPSAIAKNYSYSGHYTDATAGTQMINENGYVTSSFKNTSYTSNGTLYAHWKAKPSVAIPAISKTGYRCSWNTSADGKGTTYNAGDVTDKLNTQTLYAVCKANSYTVSYNSNGGSGTMTNDTATYDSNFITKKNTFTKTGYTFNGWNEKADGTGTVWGLTTSGVYESGKTWKWTYTKNITLYAQWKANTNTKYVVKHYKQKLDGTYPSEADDTDNLTGTADSSVSPAIKSYAGFTSPSLQTVTIAADGSTVVTYKYTRNKYTFTLGSTTGITTTGSTASGSYYYGSTITLKASANTGYTFNGWISSNTNLVANQTNASATFTMPAGNITMTPSATAKSLTFNNQSFNRTYNPTTDQKVSITAATGGSGNYGYTITSGNTSYFSISGTSITVKAGTPANTYTLKALATDINTKATKEATITIIIDKKTTSAPVSPTVKIYNAATQNHGITIPEGASIVESKSTLSAINVGTYNVVFTLNSNYKWNSNITGDIKVSWCISAYNINNATIESIEDQTYIPGDDGVKPKPKVTVPIPSGKTTTLVEGTDFTYSYYGNLNAGTAKVSVTGKGNYTSYKNATFKIVQAKNPVKVEPIKQPYGKNLVYNTQAQALVTTSNAQGNVCYSLESALTSCDTPNSIPTATDAGIYTVYYYVKGNTNYKFKAGSVQVTIDKYNLSNATITGLSNKTYNGSAQTQSGFTVTVPIPSGHTSIPTYTTSYTNNINAGTASNPNATMTLTGTGNYTGTKSATFTIGKATNPGTVTAKSLSYTGKAQELVSSNNVKGYICYSLSSTPTSCSANSSIPQGTNAGTYKVYYLISGDNNYNSKSGTVNVTIGRVNAVCPTVSVSSTSITYDGQSHEVGISGGSGGTIQYRTSTTASWTTTKPTITNAGEITTYVQVAGDSNHNTIDCGNKKIIIGKRATTCTTASASKDYNGTALTANNGTCTNLVSGHSATVSASGTITNAGSTANTYKGAVIKNGAAEVTTNYSITGANGTLTIKKVPATNPTLTAYSGTYDGQSHTISVSGGSGGTIQYSTDNKTWSTTKPTRTNVGTTTVYVKVVGDGNHTDTNPISSTITITAQKLPAPTNLTITTAGIVTWSGVSNAIKYQISIDGTNWTDATSGVDYLSKIIAATGTRTVYVRAVGTGNYSTSNNGTASTIVYTVTVNSNSTTMGTVDTSSYNVISGATYSASSNKFSFIGTTTGSTTKTLKTVTATAKSNYTFNNWSSVSGSITSNVTLTANFNSSEFTISLNSNGGTGGTSAIYERYNKGIYIDSGTNSKQMTTSANAITKPTKGPYTISFNANNTGATVPSNYSFSPVFNGYYTATTSNGTQMIDNRGYITNNLTSTKYTSNTTLYAQWNHYYTLPSLSKGGNTCKWAIDSASGTQYNSGTSLFVNDNTVFYAVCTPKSYTVTFEPNGGTSSATNMDVTYGSAYGTLPTATRSNTTDSSTGKMISYVFEGWYTAASGGTKIESTTTYNTVGNQILYAHWLSSPTIKGGSSEWSGSAVTISLEIPSVSNTGTVKYQYYLSETNELPKSGITWTDITSNDGSVSISKNGEYYIFYRAVSPQNVTITSNYNRLRIDTTVPSTAIVGYKSGTSTTVASNIWTNSYLNFIFNSVNVGPSGGTIYYCTDTEDTCSPTTVINLNTAITSRNTTTGTFYVRYKVVSGAGLSSDIGKYIAKVDRTAPSMKGIVKSLKDSSTLATLTNSSTSYDDSSWKNYGYTIDLSGTTDGESGIAKIEKYTNANNLIRSDTDYKSNLFSGDITSTKTYTEKANGAKYAKYVATDNAGNKATFIVEVLIDTEGPTMKGIVTSLKDSSTLATLTNSSTSYVDSSWKNYGYKITLSGTDSLSGISKITKYTNANNLKKTDSNYKSNLFSGDITSTKTHSESADGAKYAKFVATDKAGNTTTFTVEVLIDTVAPSPVIKLYKATSDEQKTGSVIKTIDTTVNTAINSWTNYKHYFDLSSSTDSLSGIKEMKMQINRKGINITGNTAEGTTDLVSTYTFTANKYIVAGYSGNRYIRFTITDNAGNSVVRNLRVYIDVEDPTLSSISFESRFSSSTTVSYTCSDSISGFGKFGTTNGMAVNEMMYKNVKSSSSPVTIRCKDTAGNTSTSKTYRWGANSVCGKNTSGGNKTCWHQ